MTTARLACVLVPALPLQLVLRAHPEWQDDPVVVVEDDRPMAPILWSNRAARAQRIVPGLRFAQARALSSRLHAEVVSQATIEAAVEALLATLLPCSPRIEPILVQPGLFWVDPEGLSGLFGDYERWARTVHGRLAAERFVAAVVVGFSRGPLWAIGSTRADTLVVKDAVEEQRLCGRVPLDRLGLPPALVSELALLGVERVGSLLALPLSQLRTRYGAEAARVHQFLSGKTWSPLLPRVPELPLRLELEVEPPDDDLARLSFGFKAVLQRALPQLRAEQHAVTAIELRLSLERGGERSERIEAAAPTLDAVQLVELIRLRLSGADLGGKVAYITLELEHLRVHPLQLGIAHDDGKKKRDFEAAGRAIARLRASFGAQAVTRARLREAHLPEASFRFEPVAELTLPRELQAPSDPPLVRRLYPKPVPLDSPASHEPERWLGTHGAVRAMHGPYRIAGGWWSPRGARERDYCFVETQTGELLWLFYDRARRRWLMHGSVE